MSFLGSATAAALSALPALPERRCSCWRCRHSDLPALPALPALPEAPLRLYLVEDDPLPTPPPPALSATVLGPLKSGLHTHPKGYIRISAGPYRGKYLHILIWQWTHPNEFYDPAIHDIHHINGNPLDFTPQNLKKVSHRGHSTVTQKAGRLTRDRRGKFAKVPARVAEESEVESEVESGEECPF